MGTYLSESAFYQEAERLLLQALVLSKGLYGATDLTTASVLQELGWLAHRRNQYNLAEERYRQSLAIREQVAELEPSQTARTLYTLGLLHLNRRDLAQTAVLLQRALAAPQVLTFRVRKNQNRTPTEENRWRPVLFEKSLAA